MRHGKFNSVVSCSRCVLFHVQELTVLNFCSDIMLGLTCRFLEVLVIDVDSENNRLSQNEWLIAIRGYISKYQQLNLPIL